MAPTIRIDDEVYSWLQSQARPFEDTPNSVLRRVAGFGQPGIQEQSKVSSEAPSKSPASSGHSADEGSSRNRIKGVGIRRPAAALGKELNAEWKVGARHALFHRDGAWYNNLRRFPGALFDLNGYVAFATEEDYRRCPNLKIGQETHVAGGIASIPGYVRMK